MKAIFLKDGDNFVRVDATSNYPNAVKSIFDATPFKLEHAIDYQKHFSNLSIVEVEIEIKEKIIVKAKKEIHILRSNGVIHIEGLGKQTSNMERGFIRSAINIFGRFVSEKPISLKELLSNFDRNLLDPDKIYAYDYLKALLGEENG